MPRACDSCGHSNNVVEFLRLSTCVVDRCRECGFVFLDGDRRLTTERSIYQRDHFDDGYLQQFDIQEIVREQTESVDRILRRADHPLDQIPPDAPVLDVGCARGHFLHELSSRTQRTTLTGVDLSAAMVEFGRTEFGLDLRCGAVEEVELPPDHFGLITMFDVLEHVAEPRGVLEKLFSCLRPPPREDGSFWKSRRREPRFGPWPGGRSAPRVAACAVLLSNSITARTCRTSQSAVSNDSCARLAANSSR
jgi:SAM-dependent methyltransferase